MGIKGLLLFLGSDKVGLGDVEDESGENEMLISSF